MALKIKLKAELGRFIDKTGVPAAAAGIIDSQGSLVMESAGVCGRDAPSPVQPDDQWHIGSCTKSITAVLYGQLVEQGRTGWQSTLSQLFPDLIESMHPAWHDTTIDELFYCRSGMAANPSIAFMKNSWKDKRSLVEQRSELIRSTLSMPPRNRGKFVYSNLSYVTIGGAIDRIAGASFEETLQTLLFTPLGILSSGYGAPPRIKGHSALLRTPWLHLLKGKPCQINMPESDNPAVFSSAGTLHISLADWAKFLSQFLLHNKRTALSKSVLSNSALSNSVLSKSVIESVLDAPADYQMTKGFGRVDSPDASFAIQGSNTMWVATAILSKQRDRIAIVTCNDGRSRLLQSSALFAIRLLEMTESA